MADVLILNMTVPSTCGECPVKQETNWGLYVCPFLPSYAFARNSTFRSSDCPMFQLQDHGPLVDISQAQVIVPASKEVR